MTIEIPDSHVQRAFDVLRSGEHAQARAAYEFSEKQLKVVLAKEELACDAKTVGERQAYALASEAYEKAMADHRLVAESYYHWKDRRDAASAILDAWRTLRSDERALGKVG